jgi:hypothetical protein
LKECLRINLPPKNRTIASNDLSPSPQAHKITTKQASFFPSPSCISIFEISLSITISSYEKTMNRQNETFNIWNLPAFDTINKMDLIVITILQTREDPIS